MNVERQTTMGTTATEPVTGATTGYGYSTNFIDIPVNTESFKGRDIRRSDTPETLLTDFTNRPDITIYCDKCSMYLDIRDLIYHRSYHEALITLNYRFPQKPIDTRSLLQRRNIVLKKMKAETSADNPLRPQEVTRINEAYEILKTDLEDSYEEIRQIHEKIDSEVRGVALDCSPDCAYAVGMCSHENSRWKSSMEDVKVYQDYFGEDRNKCYLGVFDGYHGVFAAERSASELHHLLLHEMAKFDSKTKSTTARNFAESVTSRIDYESLRPETRDSYRVNLHQDSTELVQNILDVCYAKYDEIIKDQVDEKEKRKKKRYRHPISDKIQRAFKKCYLLMDILLSYGKDECSKVRWSGTSAVTVIVQSLKQTQKGDGTDDNKTVDALEEEGTSGSEGQRYSGKHKGPDPPEDLGLIHIANAGNSRALLVRDGKSYRLTKDHTPQNAKEKERVLYCGGELSLSTRDTLVNGTLSVTRGLGNHGDKKLKGCVIVDPHVTTVPIDQYAQFVVLASSGVWSIFSDDEVTSLLLKMLPDQQIPPPTRVNETLMPLFREPRDVAGSKSDDLNSNESVAGSRRRAVANKEDGEGKDQEKGLSNRGSPEKSRVSFSAGPGESRIRNAEIDIEEEASNEGKGVDGEEQEVEKAVKDDAESENLNKSGDEHEQSATTKATNTLIVHGDETSDRLQVNSKRVLADLHTEMGSRMSDAGDSSVVLQPGSHYGLQEEYISMDENTAIPESRPQTIEELRREMARSMAEYLTQAALMAGSKENISVMVVLLPGCGL